MSKKKVIIVTATIAVAVAAGAGAYFYGDFSFLKKASSDDKVYVQAVESIMDSGIEGQNRYSGVVQTQKTVKVNPDGDKKVKEILVSVGDQVEEGTVLFTYDMDDQEMNLSQLKLELEEITTNITQYEKDLKELNEAKNAAPADDQFTYVTDIQAKQADIKQAEFDKQSKELEIENANKGMEVTEVTSTTAGIVKTIKAPSDDNSDSYNSYGSEEEAMITIMELGNYRIKGTVNEQNYASLIVGQDVIIRSRVDENITWSGRIKSIDTENSKDDNEDYYGDSGNSSSSYPFYVELDSIDGLIIGQHVLIEMNEGQSVKKDGLWLYESYIVTDENGSYVWARNNRDVIEKRAIELGEHDENLGEYEILSGITEDDYIAFPLASFYEGINAVTDEAEVDYSSDIYNSNSEDGEYFDEMPLDEEGFDEMPLDEEGFDEMPLDEEGFDEMPADGENLGEVPLDEENSDAEPVDGEKPDEESSDSENLEEEKGADADDAEVAE